MKTAVALSFVILGLVLLPHAANACSNHPPKAQGASGGSGGSVQTPSSSPSASGVRSGQVASTTTATTSFQGDPRTFNVGGESNPNAPINTTDFFTTK